MFLRVHDQRLPDVEDPLSRNSACLRVRFVRLVVGGRELLLISVW